MVEIIGNKVVLIEATNKDIDELYFWKFEEKEQKAKRWNGPYIPEEKVTKEEYRKGWRLGAFPDLPASLVIKCDGKAIGYVGSYWVDKNTNWLETRITVIFGTVGMVQKAINFGLITFLHLLIYIDWVCQLGQEIQE